MSIKQGIVTLIENNKEKFYRIAFAYVKNKEDALDIFHNAIVKALQGYHSLRKIEFLETWFCRILIHESITFLRKNRKVFSLEELTDAQLPAYLDPAEEYIDLYAAIDMLPAKLKTIVILRYFEDMELRTIASITATNLSTTKSRLYKALQILRIKLEDIEDDR